jgi:hypothetical protein
MYSISPHTPRTATLTIAHAFTHTAAACGQLATESVKKPKAKAPVPEPLKDLTGQELPVVAQGHNMDTATLTR